MSVRNRILLVFCFTACLGACAAGPVEHNVRISTDPSGANFFVPRINLSGRTPYEFSSIELSDIIVIAKEGYREWSRPVGDLPRIADGEYRLVLEPRK